ncbi:alpha/beta hydrolase [Endozoicomonas sp. Mp262]|uniref:alpha/beta family hydrolase n=1 Tax=Endozoicomonas sp. Mp262 TaxID=2919499 RepID=UPI0021DB6DA3
MEDNFIWNDAGEDAPVLILAHGAGAGMDSDFMEKMAGLLCEWGVTTVRFEFPYMQQRRASGKKRPPDRQPVLLEHWQKVLDKVVVMTSAPVFIGGKSMGGRMATLLLSEHSGKSAVSGVVCLGYPFYAIGKKERPRVDHLKELAKPVLILQGERDTMGDENTVSQYILGDMVNIHWLEDGNHDLKPRKLSGFSHDQHLGTAASAVANFMSARQVRE